MSASNDAASEKRPGFWKRQIKPPATGPQLVLDISFGIVFPLACIALDRIYNLGFFQANGLAMGIFEKYSIYFYSEVAVGITSMAYYVVFRQASAILAGVLLAGGIFSLLFAIMLLPFSIHLW